MQSAPVEEWVETKIYRREDGLWGVRNWFLRTLIRCSFISILVLVAALFPYWVRLQPASPSSWYRFPCDDEFCSVLNDANLLVCREISLG